MEEIIKKIVVVFFSTILFELSLVSLGYYLSKNHVQFEQPVIRSDGKGYYDYLPAIFIYKDLSFEFRKKPIENYLPENYRSLDVNYNNKTINKYPCGVALLCAPAFLLAHAYANNTAVIANGYSKPYQDAVFISAMLYLLLGLFFVKKLLIKLNIQHFVIAFSMFVILFTTPLFYYSYIDSSFSHVYSFFAISCFLYCFFLSKTNHKYLILSSFLLGIIYLLRPTNIMVVFFLPFLFENTKEIKSYLEDIWRNKQILMLAVTVFIITALIQSLIWLIQVNQLFVYSYQGEGFNFSNPQIVDFLFSFKKGLFVYSPIYALIILCFALATKKPIKWVGFILWFFAFIYISSSWHCWWYGMSFGQRPSVDFASVFSILFSTSLFKYKKKPHPYLHIIVYVFAF